MDVPDRSTDLASKLGAPPKLGRLNFASGSTLLVRANLPELSNCLDAETIGVCHVNMTNVGMMPTLTEPQALHSIAPSGVRQQDTANRYYSAGKTAGAPLSLTKKARNLAD